MCFFTKYCINTQTPRLMLTCFSFLLFLKPFLVWRGSGKLCAIGRLMVTKGYGSPPSLAPGEGDGSGWLTVRKYHLAVAGDMFIEPVKLTKAMS